MVLTEGSDRAGVMCGGVDDEVRWRGSMLRTGQVAAGLLRASGRHDSTRGGPGTVQRGSGRSGDRRRRAIVENGFTCSGGFE